jgi:hypothetical protein
VQPGAPAGGQKLKSRQAEEGAERQAASQAAMEERLCTWSRSLWQRVLGRRVQEGGGRAEEEEAEARRRALMTKREGCILLLMTAPGEKTFSPRVVEGERKETLAVGNEAQQPCVHHDEPAS